MSFRTVVIRWFDPLNKDIEDPTAFEIVNFNYQVTNLPIAGLSEDLEVFVYEEPFPQPPIDWRTHYLATHEGMYDEFSVEWPTNRLWKKTYEVLERSKEELKVSVDDEKYFANDQLFPIQKQMEYLAMYAAGIKRLVQNQTIPAALQDIFDKADAKIELIYQNHLLALQKKADIEAENPVDLDAGWENVDPETQV